MLALQTYAHSTSEVTSTCVPISQLYVIPYTLHEQAPFFVSVLKIATINGIILIALALILQLLADFWSQQGRLSAEIEDIACLHGDLA